MPFWSIASTDSGGAQALSLPRLAARIENERVRAGLVGERYLGERTPALGREDGITTVTSDLETDSTVRLLLEDPTPEQAEQAATLAAGLLQQAEEQGRPRAALPARLLLACALCTAGRVAEATQTLVPAVISCTAHGLVRPVLDTGPESTPSSKPWTRI